MSILKGVQFRPSKRCSRHRGADCLRPPLLFFSSELGAGWLFFPPQLTFITVKWLNCRVIFFCCPSWWSEGLDILKLNIWFPRCNIYAALLHFSVTPFNQNLVLRTVANTLPHPTLIYSLLCLIDRTVHLFWVSEQWGIWKWNRDVRAWGRYERNVVLSQYLYYISTNLSWMIHLASGDVSACKLCLEMILDKCSSL